eukprot:2234667-Rhodomonas_salina.1
MRSVLLLDRARSHQVLHAHVRGGGVAKPTDGRHRPDADGVIRLRVAVAPPRLPCGFRARCAELSWAVLGPDGLRVARQQPAPPQRLSR